MRRELIHLPKACRPMLSVVIHTEEEFDWSKFDRAATGVTHMRHIHRVQEIFDAFGLVPTYVVDYPIAEKEEGYSPLREFADAGRAVIGAHLHPWVSPPHVEEVCACNSYPGNLPRELEYEKLALLTERISTAFGARPKVYLAGRYGTGPNTAAILEDLGYEVDVSACVPMDFSADHGPDYSSFTPHPYEFGERRLLLGLPCTGDFVGWLPMGKRLTYHLISHHRLGWAHLQGILSRLRALDRLFLSPEGYHNEDLRRLTHNLLRRGFRVFVFSFHSPSVQPGFTPYVRDEVQLRAFLANCHEYFAFFKEECNGVGMTPLQIKGFVEQVRS